MVFPQIDTSNITNAFVSGMKEDLNLYGNQYNYIVVSWTVGYIIGQWVRFLPLHPSSVQY
jgi:ACS family pantothenate transporter-like MFS transporter